MIAVVNASPLIYLGKLGLLHLLERFFKEVVTAPSVKEEVLSSTSPESPSLEAAFFTWLTVRSPVDTPLSDRLREMGLHRGEIDVLVMAHDLRNSQDGSVVVIDDLAARDIARALGLKITGTVGIIISGVKVRALSRKEAVAKIRHLVEETSFRMSTKLFSKVIAELEG